MLELGGGKRLETVGLVGLPWMLRAEHRRRRDIERAAQVALTQEMIASALGVQVAEMRAPTRKPVRSPCI